MKILITYATCHGSTGEIAQRIARRVGIPGNTVDCRAVGDVETLVGYEAVVLGSPIHDQVWLAEATNFLTCFKADLDHLPVWLFSVGMPGALPGRLQVWAMQEEGQIEAKLSSLVHPMGHRLFSGRILQDHLTPGGRVKFRLMGGRYGDFRDWNAIDAWADSVVSELDALQRRPKSA